MKRLNKDQAWALLVLAVGAVLSLTIQGCQAPQPAPPDVIVTQPAPAPTPTPEPAQPAPQAEFTAKGFKPDWIVTAVKVLRQELPNLNVAREDMAARFCPKYNALTSDQQVQVWLNFVSAVVYRESGYNPGDAMTEITGAVSQGLLQLTYGDKFCPKKKSEGDLNDPHVNLTCGIRIMGWLASRDGVVARGGYADAGAPKKGGLAAYWSVLMVPDPHDRQVKQKDGSIRVIKRRDHHLAEIMAKTKATPGC